MRDAASLLHAKSRKAEDLGGQHDSACQAFGDPGPEAWGRRWCCCSWREWPMVVWMRVVIVWRGAQAFDCKEGPGDFTKASENFTVLNHWIRKHAA